MKEYSILWSDGNGAASRGTEGDNFVTTYIKCRNESEFWKAIYFVRKYCDILPWAEDFNSLDEIKTLLKNNADEYDINVWELFELFDGNYDVDSLDEINFDDIDAGAPWIVNIFDVNNHKQLYSDDYYDFELDDLFLDDEDNIIEEMYENFKNNNQKNFREFKKIKDNNYC